MSDLASAWIFEIRQSLLLCHLNDEFLQMMNTKLKIQVKERPDVGVYIKDLSGYVVNNADDMDRIMTLGNKNREYIWIILLSEIY